MTDFEEPVLPDDQDDQDDHLEDEYLKGGKSLRKTIITIIIVLILLLLLFLCPVDKESAKRVLPSEQTFTGKGVVGATKYRVHRGTIIYRIGDKYTYSKAKLIVVDFKVKNLSDKRQIFSSHMVYLQDESDRTHPASLDFSTAYYEAKGKNYSLTTPVGPGAWKEVTLVFTVERASKTYYLKGRDFSPKSFKTVTLPVTKVIDVEEPELPPIKSVR